MQKATNKTVEVSMVKDGTRGNGSKWFKNVYKFEGSDVWYSHFVKENTPLYPVGTVVKEITYDTDQYGGNIKSLVVGSVPSQGDQSTTPDPPGIMGSPPVTSGKQHPIWMCGRWATDLQLARMERLHPAHTEHGDTFPTLHQLADEIATTSFYLFARMNAALEGKLPDPAGLEEPLQEPAGSLSGGSIENEEPPLPEEDIPF